MKNLNIDKIYSEAESLRIGPWVSLMLLKGKLELRTCFDTQVSGRIEGIQRILTLRPELSPSSVHPLENLSVQNSLFFISNPPFPVITLCLPLFVSLVSLIDLF